MTNKRLMKLALTAVLAALSFILGWFLHIAMPGGYFTLLDIGIFTAAMLLGRGSGFFVGAVAGFLNDFLVGSPYMFFTLVAHGLQGFTGALTKNKAVNYLLSAVSMVGIYFIADLVLNYTAKAGLLHAWAVALPDLLINFVQTTVGYLVALVLVKLLKKAGIEKWI